MLTGEGAGGGLRAVLRRAVLARAGRQGGGTKVVALALGETQAEQMPLAGQGGPLRLVLRAGLALALAGLFLALLSHRMQDLDFAALGAAVWAVSPVQWAGALALTAAAFWAVGQYDAVLHRHFETGVPAAAARRAGISAIAVSQVLGMGAVTGAILRWRMMPDQSLWAVSRITMAVAVSFLAGWALVTALAVLICGSPLALGAGGVVPAPALAWAVLALAALGAALCIARPAAPFRWPNLFTLGALAGFCLVDTLAAGAALYVLLPAPAAPPLALFLPAFLLAYGAGLISGAPGGIGAFELALLALLGQSDAQAAPLLAAVLAWRLVYFVLPALIGAGVAIRGPRRPSPPPLPQRHQRLADWPARPATAPCPEIGLMAQQGHHILAQGGFGQLAHARGHILVGLFDAMGDAPSPHSPQALLSAAAQARARWPAQYKITARAAAHARCNGWRALRIAREAQIATATYDLASPARAALRRKLRRAAQAGLRITCARACAAPLPLAQMHQIAEAWAQTHGGERGFSMGQFTAPHIAAQRVFLAYLDQTLVGFASFHHIAGQAWVLDLMRHRPDLPEGGMHALIHHGLTIAQAEGVAMVSLAAVPEWAFAPPQGRALPPLQRLTLQLAPRLGLDSGQGLRQFKDSFAPRWQPRYLAAPHAPALILAALSITRAIHRPAPPLQFAPPNAI